MIYVDTSVGLAQLLAEDQRPPAQLWNEDLVTSRLFEYELWVRLHARNLARSHGDAARLLIARIALLELRQQVLARALLPFPTTVRTLDAVHLASAAFLKERGQPVVIATYDERMQEAAEAIGFDLYQL